MQTPNINAVKQNALVLANSAALAFGVFTEIGDRNISRSIGGQSMTRDGLESMVAMKLSSTIQNKG